MRSRPRASVDYCSERERAALGWTDPSAPVVLITAIDDREPAKLASRGWSRNSTAIAPGFPG